MKTIGQYFDLITTLAERSGAVSVEIEFTQSDTLSGIVDGTLFFFDGSRLEFTERIIIQNRHPVKSVYRYQYVGARHPNFRYDNAPHHPHLPNFPHHKHVGRQMLSAIEPTLQLVLDEVAAQFEASSGVAAPPRRRRSKS